MAGFGQITLRLKEMYQVGIRPFSMLCRLANKQSRHCCLFIFFLSCFGRGFGL